MVDGYSKTNNVTRLKDAYIYDFALAVLLVGKVVPRRLVYSLIASERAHTFIYI